MGRGGGCQAGAGCQYPSAGSRGFLPLFLRTDFSYRGCFRGLDLYLSSATRSPSGWWVPRGACCSLLSEVHTVSKTSQTSYQLFLGHFTHEILPSLLRAVLKEEKKSQDQRRREEGAQLGAGERLLGLLPFIWMVLKGLNSM